MDDIGTLLKQWQLDIRAVREQMYRAPTPRERERWHALWLLAQGWSAQQIAEALERDAHTVGDWLADFKRVGPAETSAAFLLQLRANHPEPLIVVWDNGPAHRGEAIRGFLATLDLRLRLVPLPGYSPDFNADEVIWDWAREEVTANTCLGTKAKVEENMGHFFQGLASRTDEVKQRCRTALQAQADTLVSKGAVMLPQAAHVDPTLALV